MSVDDIIDDLWIDIFKCLNHHEWLAMKHVCKRFNNTINDNTNNSNPRINSYWQNWSKLLCYNISPNYTTNHWMEFYKQLTKFLIKNNYITKENKSKTIDFGIASNHDHGTKGFTIREYDISFLHENSSHHEIYESFQPIRQCCVADTPMIFEMLLTKPNYYNNINHKLPGFFKIRIANVTHTIPKLLLAKVIKNCMRMYRPSINMIKHILDKYSNDIEMHCYMKQLKRISMKLSN